ncbi:translation initiation factor IF-2-like [Phacochoerus africanus]|uniref:translation initiation factor IF-2-like n=1 Tax=Phacochoerus africanus TaxID=41426 RepID=UPI001FD87B98|nr:translation initiation factor IF-2-like [Phacochoerus africanus]
MRQNRPGQDSLPRERERRERPRAGVARPGRDTQAELGDAPEVAAGSRRGWGRRRAAIHLGDVAAIPCSPRPLPIRPPTRPLAAGCCEAALPRPDEERQCLPARHSPRVSPPRPSLLASPAPRRRAQWRRRERAADPRRRVAHSTTRPRPRRPPPAPGAGKGGGWEAGPGRGSGRERIPGSPNRSGGPEAAAGDRNLSPRTWGAGSGRLQSGPRARPPGRKGSEASARGGPWRAARGRAKAGAAAASPAS